MDISGNGKAPAEETEKLNNESTGEEKAPAEEQEKFTDNTESAQSSYVAMTVSNNSEYQTFAYADYMQMFWGGCTNGLIIGVLIGLLASIIKSLYNITQNNKGE